MRREYPILEIGSYALNSIVTGTVAVVAKKLGIDYLCNELSPDYVRRAQKRIGATVYIPPLFEYEAGPRVTFDFS